MVDVEIVEHDAAVVLPILLDQSIRVTCISLRSREKYHITYALHSSLANICTNRHLYLRNVLPTLNRVERKYVDSRRFRHFYTKDKSLWGIFVTME